MGSTILSFAREALAGEGVDEVAEFHLHEDDGDLVGGETCFFDNLINGLIAAGECFQNGVFFGAEVDEVLDGAGFFVFRGREVEVGEVFEDL